MKAVARRIRDITEYEARILTFGGVYSGGKYAEMIINKLLSESFEIEVCKDEYEDEIKVYLDDEFFFSYELDEFKEYYTIEMEGE